MLVLPSPKYIRILMQLKRSDPKFNMGVNVMWPAFNLEPHYRVTVLTI